MAEPRRRRVTRACDFCHSRALRCIQLPGWSTGNPSATGCRSCHDYNVTCTTNRPQGRRGRPPRATAASMTTIQASESLTLPLPLPSTTRTTSAARPFSGANPARTQRKTVFQQLGEVYMDMVHPNYPLLDEEDIKDLGEMRSNGDEDGTNLLQLSLCAVSSLAVFVNPGSPVSEQMDGLLQAYHESYFYEAVSHVPFRLLHCRSLSYMRAFGLLALYSLRVGNFSSLHRYLALWHALVAQDGFHDERRWPDTLSSRDIESRRRVFWSMYRLEIHSACILGHIVRLPESQANVHYPSGTSTSADTSAPHSNGLTHSDSEEISSMRGWNYTTDVFRLLERALSHMRSSSTDRSLLFDGSFTPRQQDLLAAFRCLQASKPDYLISPNVIPLEGNEQPRQSDHTKRNFQIIHAMCAESLLAVMLRLQQNSPVADVGAEVEKFVNDIISVATGELRFGDVSVIHQLSGIAHLLYKSSHSFGVREKAEVRRIILCIVDLLEVLKAHIHLAADAAATVSDLAERLST